jgi:hypothetical protein
MDDESSFDSSASSSEEGEAPLFGIDNSSSGEEDPLDELPAKEEDEDLLD